jgi:SAM-dependent methyltransferase
VSDHVEANKRHWMERTAAHFAPGGWDRDGFLAGTSGDLDAVVVDEVGDVAGLDLLHLQCHFGADTLSWARRGARVTGVDFDPTAIAAAEQLARDAHLDGRATFVEHDVRTLDLGLSFDVVFVSNGALCWLPDIAAWARTVARHLRPGGFVYLFEFHPLCWALADDATGDDVRLGYTYFESTEPFYVGSGGADYFNQSARIEAPEACWNHGLGEIVTALAENGLHLEFLHEWPFASGSIVDAMVPGADGLYRLPGTDDYPLSYSLRAQAPAAKSSTI